MAAFSDFAKTKIYETYMKSVNAISSVSNESNFKVMSLLAGNPIPLPFSQRNESVNPYFRLSSPSLSTFSPAGRNADTR